MSNKLLVAILEIIENFSSQLSEASTSLLLCLLVTVVCFLYWKLFHQTFDLVRTFDELGFEEADRKYGKGKSRMNAVNQLRRRRKLGKLPPPYPNGWFAVIESDNLKVGQVREVYACGENLVAWRGSSGNAYVANAYCPHLGAHLGVGGEVVGGDCIQCPFHGWAFDGKEDGKLAQIPYAEKLPDFVKLKLWKVRETNGYIFLWYHTNNEEPTWELEEITEINQRKWGYRGRSEMYVACHIQEIPENGPDVAHLNVVHSSPVLCGDSPKTALFSWSFIKHVWDAKWEVSKDRKHEAVLKVHHYILLFGRWQILHIHVDVVQVGPGIVHLFLNTAFGKGVFVQTVTPVEPLMQCVIHRFYTSALLLHPIAKMMLDGEAKQISRDIRIWNRKCYMDKPVLTKEDNAIKSYRRWFLQFYTSDDEKGEQQNHKYFSDKDKLGF